MSQGLDRCSQRPVLTVADRCSQWPTGAHSGRPVLTVADRCSQWPTGAHSGRPVLTVADRLWPSAGCLQVVHRLPLAMVSSKGWLSSTGSMLMAP
ncbi:hypothetical protein ACOMHN_043155 [Nucella lapillus]